MLKGLELGAPPGKLITGNDPAAGAEALVTVPAGVSWEVLSFNVELVTDATAASRNVELVLDDGANEYAHLVAGGAQAASQTRDFTWAVGGILGTGNGRTAGLPPGLVIPAGHRLRTESQLLAAGDNYGPPRLWVLERALT